jgi:hypothetical protein
LLAGQREVGGFYELREVDFDFKQSLQKWVMEKITVE